ncbi:hypothetical protein L2E82_44251 [Cichorium intybus]|uniref:Uncharacterized protein n=1 Tax=Cichorium intybus TaxID=13427 RepID=A0ACB8ZQJ4_CICIN|nr:hypothetical protein L2E82_44251 [Cichorium intybus]
MEEKDKKENESCCRNRKRNKRTQNIGVISTLQPLYKEAVSSIKTRVKLEDMTQPLLMNQTGRRNEEQFEGFLTLEIGKGTKEPKISGRFQPSSRFKRRGKQHQDACKIRGHDSAVVDEPDRSEKEQKNPKYRGDFNPPAALKGGGKQHQDACKIIGHDSAVVDEPDRSVSVDGMMKA